MKKLDPHRDDLQRIASWMRDCQNLLVVTGAGISAESGLPTYRGVGGLYDVDTTEEGMPIEEILSGQMWRTSPELTWKYLMQIACACEGASFSRAHGILAEMERHIGRMWVVTQNVDGFHRAAGSQQVLDLHGDLHDLMCTECDFRERIARAAATDRPPRCPHCQALVRPDVVLFGEMLSQSKMQRLQQELSTGFDLVFSIGTSSMFPYIVWPIEVAKAQGIPTVEINPAASEISRMVDVKLPLRAGEALEAIWQLVLKT